MSQYARAIARGDSGDHAINQTARRDRRGPARSVDLSGAVKINDGLEGQQLETCEQAAKLPLALSIARTRRHLHDHRLGDGDIRGIPYELGEPDIGGTSGRPVELDPGRGVDEDQAREGR